MKDKKDPFDHPFFTDTDNYMRKQAIYRYIYIACLGVLVWFLTGLVWDSINKASAEAKSTVGKIVVIQKDTLTVIGYSVSDKTYKLSNGLDYDMDFIKTKVIK